MDNKYFIDVPITVTGLDGLVELADELKEKVCRDPRNHRTAQSSGNYNFH